MSTISTIDDLDSKVRVVTYPVPGLFREALGWASVYVFHLGLVSIPVVVATTGVLTVLRSWKFVAPLFSLCALGVWPHKKWPAFERAWRPLFETWCQIFRTTLIFESPQVPEQFVLTVHPHGVIPVTGMLIWGSTQSHGYHPDHFGGSNAALSLPFFRQFLLWNGGVSATKKVVAATLAKAKSFSIFSGGINEMAATRAGCDTVVLTPRVGVIRLAKEHGKFVVPVFTFGVTQTFDRFPPPDASWVRWLSRQLRVAIMYPVGRWWLPVPMFSRITIVFGAPMDTSTKSAEEVHVEWVEWFKTTHAKYRTLAGCADRELVVL